MTELAGTGAQPTVRLCKSCKHMRTRPKVLLFGESSLQSSGALKAQTEWNQEEKQRAQLELQRYQARRPFDYEPHNYAWCARFTRIDLVANAQRGDDAALQQLMREGGATMNPVSGEVQALYHLCAWHNENGDCDGYDPR
jgi:hypothetical protein